MAFGTPTNIGTNTSTASTVVITVGAGGVPSGCLLVLVILDNINAAIGTVADTAGNTYNLITSKNPNNAGSNGIGGMFYVKNATALVNTNTITYTAASGTGAKSISAFYVTGADTTAPLNTTTLATATGNSSSPSVTSVAPGESGDLFVNGLLFRGVATITQDSINAAWATPFVSITQANSNVGGANVVNAGSGALTYAPTLSVSSQWASIITSFKVAAAAGGTSSPMPLTMMGV